MEYNFKMAFGGNFTAKNFKNTMHFIHAYNEAKLRLGAGATEDAIISNLSGYSPELARELLRAIKYQFGGVPTRDKETKFMKDYHSYMKKEYEEQRARVLQAQKDANEEKKFKSPNGLEYSASELKKAGEKAKKDASKSRFAKIMLIAIGAVLGSVLLPMLLTSAFAGVMAVTTISTLSAVGGITGLVAGGILGARVYDMGGRKERLENNNALAKFMAENIDAINLAESNLQSQQASLNSLEQEFDLGLNPASGMVESVAFNEVYDAYATEEIDENSTSKGREVVVEPQQALSQTASEITPDPELIDEAVKLPKVEIESSPIVEDLEDEDIYEKVREAEPSSVDKTENAPTSTYVPPTIDFSQFELANDDKQETTETVETAEPETEPAIETEVVEEEQKAEEIVVEEEHEEEPAEEIVVEEEHEEEPAEVIVEEVVEPEVVAHTFEPVTEERENEEAIKIETKEPEEEEMKVPGARTFEFAPEENSVVAPTFEPVPEERENEETIKIEPKELVAEEEIVGGAKTFELATEEENEQIEEPTSLLSDAVKKSKTSTLKAKYTRAINKGECSPVGQYMLVALREQAKENIDNCQSEEELNEVLEIATEEIKQIVDEYKKYTTRDGKNSAICLTELPASEQGKKAKETDLPAEFMARVPEKTYVSALKRGYVKTNEKLLDAYLKTVGADERTSKEVKNQAKLDTIQEMAEAKNFAGISTVLAENENSMNKVKDEIAKKVNENGSSIIVETMNAVSGEDEASLAEKKAEEERKQAEAEEKARIEALNNARQAKVNLISDVCGNSIRKYNKYADEACKKLEELKENAKSELESCESLEEVENVYDNLRYQFKDIEAEAEVESKLNQTKEIKVRSAESACRDAIKRYKSSAPANYASIAELEERTCVDIENSASIEEIGTIYEACNEELAKIIIECEKEEKTNSITKSCEKWNSKYQELAPNSTDKLAEFENKAIEQLKDCQSTEAVFAAFSDLSNELETLKREAEAEADLTRAKQEKIKAFKKACEKLMKKYDSFADAIVNLDNEAEEVIADCKNLDAIEKAYESLTANLREIEKVAEEKEKAEEEAEAREEELRKAEEAKAKEADAEEIEM